MIEHQGNTVVHGYLKTGNDCVIWQGVTIGNRVRSRPLDAPTLSNNVNVGAGAVILGDITISDNVNIRANSVVIKNLPAGATAVGIPAKVIKVQSTLF